jgi:hypothetical protein
MSSTVTPRKRPASSSPPPSASAGDPSTRASRGNGNESPFLASRNGAGMGLGVTRGRDGYVTQVFRSLCMLSRCADI